MNVADRNNNEKTNIHVTTSILNINSLGALCVRAVRWSSKFQRMSLVRLSLLLQPLLHLVYLPPGSMLPPPLNASTHLQFHVPLVYTVRSAHQTLM